MARSGSCCWCLWTLQRAGNDEIPHQAVSRGQEPYLRLLSLALVSDPVFCRRSRIRVCLDELNGMLDELDVLFPVKMSRLS